MFSGYKNIRVGRTVEALGLVGSAPEEQAREEDPPGRCMKPGSWPPPIAEALAAGESEGATGSGMSGARRPIAVEIRVHDPIHVAPESARMHAELALRARGLDDVAIEVTADPVDVRNVRRRQRGHADHPYCEACGWPLPDKGGHQVEAVIRWAAA